MRDFTPDEFKTNVLALADIAKFFKRPALLTAGFEDGPDGPMVPEIRAAFPDASDVFAVTDASGTFNPVVRAAAWGAGLRTAGDLMRGQAISPCRQCLLDVARIGRRCAPLV